MKLNFVMENQKINRIISLLNTLENEYKIGNRIISVW